MTRLRKLFEPIKIGEMELKNRIMMLCANASGGGDNRISFYAERAAGGAGLICVGGMYTFDPGTSRTPNLPPLEFGLYGDELIPWLRNFTSIMHDRGAKVAAQLLMNYEWKRDWKTNKDGPTEIVGASNVASGPQMGNARELLIDEIHQIIEEYGDAAKVARQAGFDAIEIQAGMGYLLNRFLSPRSNKRTDEYGGSIENRVRILIEIVKSCHEKAGTDYPIIVRLSGDDLMEGGNTLEDIRPMAVALERAGIAALDVEAGWHESTVPLIQQWVRPGAFIYLAEEVKKVVNIPVIGSYRINDPFLANKIVAEGRIDLVGMGRQLIADPEFPNKAKDGRFDEICYCIACCRCLDLVREVKQPGCSVNAKVGREAKYVIEPATGSKKVLVIGGGPAGLEAARVAALRGHTVTLCDKGPRLGGSLLLEGIFNPELPRFLKYKLGQIRRLPIKIKLSTDVSAAFVEQLKPEVVIMAAGGRAPALEIPGGHRDNVLLGHDMLEAMIHPPKKRGVRQRLLWRLGYLPLRYFYQPALIRWGLKLGFPFRKRVAIIGGGFAGCELADTLAERGKKVSILEESPRLGYDIGMSTRWVVMMRLRDFGVKMEKNAKAVEITDKGVKVRVNGSEKFSEADTVVLATPLEANDRFARHLERNGWLVHSIGDCAEPGRLMEALEAGFRVGNEI